MLLRQVECHWCYKIFYVCQRCWRGQAYCSEGCSRAGAHHAHREAQRRYRQTSYGREAHREAERRRRMRIIKKTVDDGTSTPVSTRCTLSSSYSQAGVKADNFYSKTWRNIKGRCHYCGITGAVVKKFPRRGYGRRDDTGEKRKRELRM